MPVSRRRNENAAYTVSSPDIRRTSPADSLWQSTLLFVEYGVACAKEWNTIFPQRDRFVGHEWATPCILRKGSFNKAPKLVQHQVGEEEGCRVNNERSERSYSVYSLLLILVMLWFSLEFALLCRPFVIFCLCCLHHGAPKRSESSFIMLRPAKDETCLFDPRFLNYD